MISQILDTDNSKILHKQRLILVSNKDRFVFKVIIEIRLYPQMDRDLVF